MSATSKRVLLLIALCVAAVAYAGSYHFIYGAGVNLYRLKKISWSLSETVINKDELEHLPVIFVRMHYPLLMAAMEAAQE